MSEKPSRDRTEESSTLPVADTVPMKDLLRQDLPPEAQRALAEAAARRQSAEKPGEPASKEVNGPKGPEPTRYGDWETKGIASDF